MNFIGGRLLRGVLGAALASLIGWIAGQLTIGMILSRQFDAGQQQQIERVLPYVYLIAGFATGAGFDPRWLNSPSMRPMCWGGASGLLLVMIPIRLILWRQPELEFRGLTIFGMPTRITLETIGLSSAPGALLAGGFLGWFFYGLFSRRRKDRLDESEVE